MGYKTHAFKGISWLSLLRISTRGITFVRLAILARILTPTQFGIFGVASLALALLEVLTETGINVFLIQKKDKSHEFISSAWLVSIVRGCLISLLLILGSSFIADFFNSPESMKVLILIAAVPLIRGFINPSIINIQKNLEFQKEFYLRSILFAVDAVIAITVAFITKSAESFAYGLIFSAVLEVILSFLLFRPWPKMDFELEKVKHIVSRGFWVTLTGIFSYFSDNGDNLAVGRLMGSSSLGLYQVAYRLSTLTVSEITEVVNKVTFPIYLKFSDDRKRLFKAFIKVSALSSLIAGVVGAIIFVFAAPIVLLMLGEKWISIIAVVQILAIYGIVRTIFGNFSSLFLSLERQDYVAKMTFTRVVALILLLYPMISQFGLMGAAYSMLISIFAEIPIILFFTYKLFSKEIKLSVG
jgi:O-antigen/teichoic acid export membrane protein